MYDDDRLKQFRRNFLKENRPKENRRLVKVGELEARLQAKADACRKEVARLVEDGITFEAQGQWAIRDVLLGSPWD